MLSRNDGHGNATHDGPLFRCRWFQAAVTLILAAPLLSLGIPASSSTEPPKAVHLRCDVWGETTFPEIEFGDVIEKPMTVSGAVYACTSPSGRFKHLRWAYFVGSGFTQGCGTEFKAARGRILSYWNVNGEPPFSDKSIKAVDFNGKQSEIGEATFIIGADLASGTATATTNSVRGPLSGLKGTATFTIFSRGPDGAPNAAFCPSTGTVFHNGTFTFTD